MEYKGLERGLIIHLIIDEFDDHEDLFEQAIEELDSYNGYLGDDRYYDMEEIDEFFPKASDALARAYYGYDADTWTTDARGERTHEQFCPNRAYFSFNGYGNFVSSDTKDYSGFLGEDVVEEMAEHREEIYTINENENLKELFDALESAGQEDQDE